MTEHAVNTKASPSSTLTPEFVWILIGAALYAVALAVSAWAVPALRVLHAFQALIYVALVVLARRNSMWGYGAGVTIAVAWNSLSLFVTHLVQAGFVAFWSFLHTGQLRRLDTMMVAVGAIGHFIIIGACIVAIMGQPKAVRAWSKFAGGGILALGYLILIIVLFRPR